MDSARPVTVDEQWSFRPSTKKLDFTKMQNHNNNKPSEVEEITLLPEKPPIDWNSLQIGLHRVSSSKNL